MGSDLTSVQRGIGWHQSEDAERAALPPQHVGPERLGVGGEDVLGERELDDPRAFLELTVELAGAPARISRVHTRPAQLAEGVRIDLRGEKSDRVEYQRAGSFGLDEVGEDDDRRRLDGTSEVHLADIVDEFCELGDGLGDRRLGRAVQDHAERSFLRMLADENDGSPEARVDERRARDQKVPFQRLHCHNHRRMEGVSREIRLVARPQGFPGEDLFEVAETPIPDPADGQLLIRNAYFSVDPYMRPRMNDVRSYVAPFTLGEAMTGGAVGQVVVSRTKAHPEGSWVLHSLGWREWALSDGSGLRSIDPSVAPVSTSLGVLGMPGLTAYYGLFELGAPKEGETVFVSGAAGAVGSTVGQMAKIAGCRVIGSAGSEEKLAWLRELGFDAAFNYRERKPREALAELAADGIDIYFDNVGGDHLEAAIGALRARGRVVACGSISRYNDVEPASGPRNMFMVVTKRLRIQGYIVSDHFDRFGEFYEQAVEWVGDGRLRYRETVIEGIEKAPHAFVGLLRGENIGKMLVKVGPSE